MSVLPAVLTTVAPAVLPTVLPTVVPAVLPTALTSGLPALLPALLPGFLPAVLAGLAAALAVAGPGESGRLSASLPRRAQTDLVARGRAGLDALAGRSLAGPHRGVARVAAGAVAPVAAAAVGLVASGPALALVAALGAAVLGAALRRRVRVAALAAERRGAGEACALLAAELRAGRSAGQALEAAAAVAVGPFRGRLLAGAACARFGGDTAAALRDDAGGSPTGVPEAAAGLAACWSVCAGTGSGLADAVDRLEQGLRGEAEARRAVDAELGGPRATAGLLAVLPLAGIGLAAGLGARPGHVLLETTVGGVCLVLGVGLDLLGLAWSRRIARAAGAD